MMDHVAEYFFWRFEAEWRRVTNVELQYLVAFFFEPLGFFQYRPANVITDIVKLPGFGEDARLARGQRGNFRIRGFHDCSAGLAQLEGSA